DPCRERALVEGVDDENAHSDPSNREQEDGRQRGEVMAHDAQAGRQREGGNGQEQDFGFHLSLLAWLLGKIFEPASVWVSVAASPSRALPPPATRMSGMILTFLSARTVATLTSRVPAAPMASFWALKPSALATP